MSFRKRVTASAVNSPVVASAHAAVALSSDETQQMLDQFISECDHLEATAMDKSYHGPDSTTLSQLKRLQRELRGLPPLLLEGQAKERSEKVPKKTVFEDAGQKPKKIVFDDDTVGAEATEVDETVMTDENSEEKVKKRKLEKKEKKDKKDKKERKDKKNKKEKSDE
ncbi:hypothetical protein KL925_005359 [Ogataea polymorpha]|nr:hypothetical protein KL936_005411 [Ogataea polymorpha]KAG7897295.1 hypothetical protein KL935_005366 [Ogataea polymorpha]KAG7905139.1 hypothetical protein KL906_005322 [Ogataea polymorpha]KAG7912947.1 hypothetical protein KL927_005368 [Ogataea polymorpha]KAG7924409.1 hypothetical protein KL925_005359 [Ogataea polymorpha]